MSFKHHVDHEIRDMMSVLSRRLSQLHKKTTDQASASHTSDHDHEEEDDRGGLGVITMAGSNEGATMRGDLGSMSMESPKFDMKERNDEQSLPPLRTCLNSNFQAVNNSIMVGGSYSSNDPGIHLDVEDFYEQKQGKAGLRRHGRKGKQKAHSGSSSKSDHAHSGSSSSTSDHAHSGSSSSTSDHST